MLTFMQEPVHMLCMKCVHVRTPALWLMASFQINALACESVRLLNINCVNKCTIFKYLVVSSSTFMTPNGIFLRRFSPTTSPSHYQSEQDMRWVPSRLIRQVAGSGGVVVASLLSALWSSKMYGVRLERSVLCRSSISLYCKFLWLKYVIYTDTNFNSPRRICLIINNRKHFFFNCCLDTYIFFNSNMKKKVLFR